MLLNQGTHIVLVVGDLDAGQVIFTKLGVSMFPDLIGKEVPK